MAQVKEITGTITLADGSVSEFSLSGEGSWQQWGAVQDRLFKTVEALETISNALESEDLLYREDEDSDDELEA